MNILRQSASIAWMCCAVFLSIALERTACGADKANASATVSSPNGKIMIGIRADAAGQ